MRAYLNENFQEHCLGQRGAVDSIPRSSDLTPAEFCLWGTLKDVVYRRKLTTLAAIRHGNENASAAIPLETLASVAQAVVQLSRS